MNKEKVEELLDKIGIEKRGKIKSADGTYEFPDKYIIRLKDSDEYARMYTLLDKYEHSHLYNDGSMSSEYATVMTYEVGGFKIMLNANFESDYYSIVVEEEGE